MNTNFYFFYTVILFFFSCAAQGPATGGPPDKQGPKLISVEPSNQSINIPQNQKITLTFSELLDPISVPSSILINNNYKLKIRGRKIILIPVTVWPKNQMINIYLSRKIRDYQKNIMSNPIQLAFTTGNDISQAYIAGNIIEFNKDNLIEVGLFKWPLTDNNKFLQKVETDKNGNFKFSYLDYGEYIIGAIEGELTDFSKQLRKKKYAMSTENKISLTPDNPSKYSKMILSEPLEQLIITSVEMKSQYSINLIMNNHSEEVIMIDSMYSIGDSISINLVKSNRLESYTLPPYTFILPEILDTIGPINNDIRFSSETLSIHFNEPIKSTSESITAEYNNLEIPLKFKIEDLNTIILGNLDDSITHVKLHGNYIYDWNNNVMPDSIKLIPITKSLEDERIIIGGNILGTIIYSGKNPVSIRAHSINNKNIYHTEVVNNKFRLENLEQGIYTLWAYESLHENVKTYFSGLWEPYHRAAHFTIYPDSVDVRARWDIEGIIINFD